MPRAIVFLCSECSETIRVPISFAGREGRCRHCMRPIEVPSRERVREGTRRLTRLGIEARPDGRIQEREVPTPLSPTELLDMIDQRVAEQETVRRLMSAAQPEGETAQAILFVCPQSWCGETLRVPATMAGLEGRCAVCKEVLTVPSVRRALSGTLKLLKKGYDVRKDGHVVPRPDAAVHQRFHSAIELTQSQVAFVGDRPEDWEEIAAGFDDSRVAIQTDMAVEAAVSGGDADMVFDDEELPPELAGSETTLLDSDALEPGALGESDLEDELEAPGSGEDLDEYADLPEENSDEELASGEDLEDEELEDEELEEEPDDGDQGYGLEVREDAYEQLAELYFSKDEELERELANVAHEPVRSASRTPTQPRRGARLSTLSRSALEEESGVDSREIFPGARLSSEGTLDDEDDGPLYPGLADDEAEQEAELSAASAP